jgi:hypothetical protein
VSIRQVTKVLAATQHEVSVCSGLSEEACEKLALDVVEQQVGAWLIRQSGRPHEPLASLVVADGLDSTPGGQRVWRPLDIAAERWAALSPVQREIEPYRYDTIGVRTVKYTRRDPWTRAARLGVRVQPRAGSVCAYPRRPE